MPTVTYPPPWEAGCGAADPAVSNNFASYSGSGYGTKGTGKLGTINVYSATVTPGPQPAQVRFFVGSDGNLYGLDNATGKTFLVNAGGTAVQLANYTPTRTS